MDKSTHKLERKREGVGNEFREESLKVIRSGGAKKVTFAFTDSRMYLIFNKYSEQKNER